MNSAGHRANILQPAYREIGFGVLAGNPSSPRQRRRHVRHRVRRHRPRPRTSSGRSRSTPRRAAPPPRPASAAPAPARPARAPKRPPCRARRARAARARAALAPGARRGRIVGSVAVVRGTSAKRLRAAPQRRTLGLEPAVSLQGVPHGVLRPARPGARGRQPHRRHPRPARLRARARRSEDRPASRCSSRTPRAGSRRSPIPRTTPTPRRRPRSSWRCRCSRRPPARR